MKPAALLLGRALAALGLAALLAQPAAAAAPPLRLAVNQALRSAPVLVAEAEGYFAAEGVAVQTMPCTVGLRCMELLLAGQADLATMAELPVVLNGFERSDYAIVASLGSATRDVKLITRRSAAIATAHDLVGKRVASVRGASPHYVLDAFLLYSGIDPAGVTLLTRQPEQLIATLQSGEADAIAIWEPHASLALQTLGDAVSVLPMAGLHSETFALVARRPLPSEREADIVRLLRALARAEQLMHEQPRRAQAIVGARLKLSPQLVERVWADSEFRLGLQQSLVGRMEREAQWAQRLGLLPAGPLPNYLRLLEPAALRQVRPAAVTLVK